MNKRLVLLRASMLSLSGYGQHARQLGDWLLQLEKTGAIELYCEPLMWGNTTWIVDSKRDELTRELMLRCKPLPRKPDVSVQLQLPNEWDPSLANVNIGFTAAVETDVAPKMWVQPCRNMDAVVFPSKHSMNSIVKAGWEDHAGKAFVIPECFPDELLTVDVDTSSIDPLPPFTFLVFGQLTSLDNGEADRKNIHNTVSWLLKEFAGDQDVGILLKTNVGRSTVFDAYHTENILQNVVRSVKTTVGDKALPQLHLIHGDMSAEDVAKIYRHPNVKALVTATRGEGFGLPILEAAACDLPVIATAWSAHVEFLSLGRYVDLPCTLKEVHKSKIDNKIFAAGSKWANVEEQDFRRRLRKFRESNNIPKQWAKDLGVKIRSQYSREANIRLLTETLEMFFRSEV